MVSIDIHGQTSPEYNLTIALTNRLSEPLTTYQYGLPWGGRHSIMLLAAKADATSTLLDSSAPVDDPGPTRVTIAPGETLTGKIPLERRFPGFLEALKEREVVVFWSYQFQPIDRPPLPRVGGCVIFPQIQAPSVKKRG